MAEDFHHALQFKYDLCIGCAHCTGVCPTGAIHVEDGHPHLNPNRCVDCGRCYQACPVNAIYIEQDDFNTVYDYKYPVLLLPSIFTAQFEEKIKERTILSAIYHLGFKHVFEVEKSVGPSTSRPSISRNCLPKRITCPPRISGFSTSHLAPPKSPPSRARPRRRNLPFPALSI